jgi:hypothetical protein
MWVRELGGSEDLRTTGARDKHDTIRGATPACGFRARENRGRTGTRDDPAYDLC